MGANWFVRSGSGCERQTGSGSGRYLDCLGKQREKLSTVIGGDSAKNDYVTASATISLQLTRTLCKSSTGCEL